MKQAHTKTDTNGVVCLHMTQLPIPGEEVDVQEWGKGQVNALYCEKSDIHIRIKFRGYDATLPFRLGK